MKHILAKKLGNILTEFGANKKLTLIGAISVIEVEMGEILPDLEGPEKFIATKFMRKCGKAKDLVELFTIVSETMFGLTGMGENIGKEEQP